MATRIRDMHEAWSKKPGYRKAYDALEGEFELVAALIEARQRAGLSQAELAARIGTKQPAIARMEGGKLPSTTTLQRIAAATGNRLRISFEPQGR